MRKKSEERGPFILIYTILHFSCGISDYFSYQNDCERCLSYEKVLVWSTESGCLFDVDMLLERTESAENCPSWVPIADDSLLFDFRRKSHFAELNRKLDVVYRVAIQVVPNLPLTSKQNFRFSMRRMN